MPGENNNIIKLNFTFKHNNKTNLTKPHFNPLRILKKDPIQRKDGLLSKKLATKITPAEFQFISVKNGKRILKKLHLKSR